ncbi:hypothetical protein [Pseudolysinimonas kribbensis]|uniref:hypothetical protein n=1 Tax=Pseudolysinimonas kribbensis TaxID=433641 RepID=UPI0031CEC57C
MTRVGPLLAVHVDPDGWRVDGVQLGRRILRGVLPVWKAAITGEWIEFRFSAEDVVERLDRYWGGDRRQVARHEASDGLSDVDASIVDEWERLVFAQADVRRWVAEQIPVYTSAVANPLEDRPVEPAPNDWNQWPRRDRRVILERLAALDGEDADDLDPTTSERLVAALREVITPLITSYMRDSAASNLGRHINRVVLRAWHRSDKGYFGSPPPDVGAPAGSGVGNNETMTILQMMAFEALGPSVEKLRAALKRRGESGPLSAISDRKLHPLGEMTGWDRQRQLENAAMREHATSASDVKSAAAVAEFLTQTMLIPSRATHWATTIQDAGPDERPDLIERYLDLRQAVAWHAPVDDEGLARIDGARPPLARRRQISLADQLVRLQAVHVKRPDLVERIIRIQHHESGTFDHGELGDRDMGLVAGKLGDRFGGLATLAATHRALTKQLSQGDEARATTLLEDLQQTTLSICGACISLLDEYLMVVRHRSQIPASLQQMSRIALSYSSNAYDMLSDLAARFPDTRLPDARLADHQHISWYGWIQTALQNRLRAMIDVATARRARLMPSVKRGLGSALDASLPTIRAHYLELLTLSPSTSTTRTALGMQGTWLALLDSGRLPQPPDDRPAPVLLDLRFLDGIEVELGESADWHNDRGDHGTLGRIGEATLAWRALVEASGVPDSEGAGPHALSRVEIWRGLLA